MKKIINNIMLILIFCLASCQTKNNDEFNFGFEKISNENGLPDNWVNGSTKEYVLNIDNIESNSGKRSMLIEFIGPKVKESAGGILCSIPLNYSGDTIELRAFMKLEDVSDEASALMLQIVGDNQLLQNINSLQDNIKGSIDWKMYSLKSPLPENAQNLTIGAYLLGSGKLWVDDFQILIDGEDIRKVKPKEKQVFKADNDNEFDNGSNILIQDLSPLKIEDIAVLGKIWGFLKYYHPTIAKGEYNWDYELFRILPEVLNCQNQYERNEILSQWISDLGEVEQGGVIESDESQIKIKPDLDWINDSIVLGAQLSYQLRVIRNAKRSKVNYYVKIGSGKPIFTHEKQYLTSAIPDAGFRLLSLFRYWNIIQYFFPYKNLIEEDWSDILKEFIPLFINSTSELMYKLNTLALIATIHDTHAYIQGDQTLESFKGVNYVPIDLQFIEDKLVVTKIRSDWPSERQELQVGDIILSTNGADIQEHIKWMLPITPASNYPTQLRNIARDYFRTNDTVLNLTFARDGLTRSMNIKCYPYISYDASEKKPSSGYSNLELITPAIAYLYPVNINPGLLDDFMNKIQYTDGLIIDLRCYPEFIVYNLCEYLMPDTTAFMKFSYANITEPGLFTFSKTQTVGKQTINFYKGKVVIIVNEETQSRAEFTAMALRMAPRAIVIGSTTAGADGEVSDFFLPGGINTRMSGMGVYYPDGRETQRVGIVPDIEIKPTIKGIKEGRDELIEKAIDLINKK